MLNRDFKEFIQSLNDNQVRYLIVGGYAVALHGHPRYTKDIDIWIEMEPGNATNLVKALDDWVAATNSRDVGGQLAHYAPRLTSFYLSRDVPREAVRAEKVRAFGGADSVEISIADPQIRVARDGRTAVLRFRKQFIIKSAGQRRSGEVLQELRWARTPAGWKITSERDLQVIR